MLSKKGLKIELSRRRAARAATQRDDELLRATRVVRARDPPAARDDVLSPPPSHVIELLSTLSGRVRAAFCHNDSAEDLFGGKMVRGAWQLSNNEEWLNAWSGENRSADQWAILASWLSDIIKCENHGAVALYEPRLFVEAEVARMAADYDANSVGRVHFWDHGENGENAKKAVQKSMEAAVPCAFLWEFGAEQLTPDFVAGSATLILVDNKSPFPAGRARDVLGFAHINMVAPHINWGHLAFFCSSRFRRRNSISQASLLMANVLNLFLLRANDNTEPGRFRTRDARPTNVWLQDASGEPGFYKSYGIDQTWTSWVDTEYCTLLDAKSGGGVLATQKKLREILVWVWARATKLVAETPSDAAFGLLELSQPVGVGAMLPSLFRERG